VLKPPLLPRLAAAEAHLRPARLRAERVLHRKVSPVQVQRIGDPQAGAPLVAALLLLLLVVAWLLSTCCCCCCCLLLLADATAADALVLLRQFCFPCASCGPLARSGPSVLVSAKLQ